MRPSGSQNVALGFLYKSSLRPRSNLGREAFHSGPRNDLNLHMKFVIVILIRQNKCNHLLFLYAKFHTILCKKIAAVNTSLKMIFDCKVFATKLYAPDCEMFGSEKNLEQFFRVALRSICGPLIWMSKDMCFSDDEMR